MATKKNNDYDFKFDDKVEKDSLIYDHDRNDTPTEEEIANMPFKERMSYRFDYRVKALLITLAVLIAVGSCIFYLCRPVDRPHVSAIALMDGIRFTLEDEKIVRKDFLNSLKDPTQVPTKKRQKNSLFITTTTIQLLIITNLPDCWKRNDLMSLHVNRKDLKI